MIVCVTCAVLISAAAHQTVCASQATASARDHKCYMHIHAHAHTVMILHVLCALCMCFTSWLFRALCHTHDVSAYASVFNIIREGVLDRQPQWCARTGCACVAMSSTREQLLAWVAGLMA